MPICSADQLRRLMVGLFEAVGTPPDASVFIGNSLVAANLTDGKAALREATTEQLIAHCRRVAEAIPLFGFYLQPAVGGRLLGYEFWRAFFEIDQVVAVKIAPFNRYQTLDVIRALADSGRRHEIALYTGNDDNIVPDLLTEFCVNGGKKVHFAGGLLGHWAVWTQRAVELLEAVHTCKRNAGEGAFSPYAGGAVFNTAIAMGRMGAPAGFFTALADSGDYDVLVVDRMLPKRDGLSIIGTLRAKGNHTPALILSALGQVDDRIKGLRAGGDDYLPKPYSFAELLARVEVLSRRHGGPSEETTYRVGDLELDAVGAECNDLARAAVASHAAILKVGAAGQGGQDVVPGVAHLQVQEVHPTCRHRGEGMSQEPPPLPAPGTWDALVDAVRTSPAAHAQRLVARASRTRAAEERAARAPQLVIGASIDRDGPGALVAGVTLGVVLPHDAGPAEGLGVGAHCKQ